jgi:putative phosphoesterase
MRILLTSDLHGNEPALAAIRERFDACLCLGDLVEYGPNPGACVDWVRQTGAITVRGNHDHGAAQGVDIQGASGFRYLTMATRASTAARLTETDRRFLADLPTSRMLTLGGAKILLVHASPRDPLDEYVPPDPAAWAPRLAGVSADFVCVGHTHVQYVLPVGSTTVVNPGSVGLQRDGDPRARYAVIEDGRVELKQVEYDPEPVVAEVAADPHLPGPARRILTDVYRLGRYVHPPELPTISRNGTNGHSHPAPAALADVLPG